ncbi:MAG: hypothetical protein M1819_005076 [Sarea resinae]|nr:MAG: hypothetical protein M1819_005076 [Sarea resinae]
MASSQTRAYDPPGNYSNVNEVVGPPPVENPQDAQRYRHHSLEEAHSDDTDGARERQVNRARLGPRHPRREGRRPSEDEYTEPDDYANLDEVASPAPVQTEGEDSFYYHTSLEERRSRDGGDEGHGGGSCQPPTNGLTSPKDEALESPPASSTDEKTPSPTEQRRVSRAATEIYTVSYLIFFSFLGTLARLGVEWLTFYPGAPVALGVLWANFGGSLFMGYLSEDRRLFREEWGHTSSSSPPSSSSPSRQPDPEATTSPVRKAEHSKIKKTIPLYIGLATGFCGSFTSFSTFMRDIFLSLSNSLPTPVSHPSPPNYPLPSSTTTIPRPNGYSVLAVLGTTILTLSLCLSALTLGAHIALLLQPMTPTLSFRLTRRILDPLAVFLAITTWLGAVFMAIFPPDRPSGPASHGRSSWTHETWRGQAVFALVFAPLGTLTRFYLSLALNGRIAAFPLGTFVVNAAGTALLGMAYDLQHAPLPPSSSSVGGGRLGCQVLQGIMDGFCGCLTTVSTWVAELHALRRRHAWLYGAASVGVGVALLVVEMGSVRWSVGFREPACVTGQRGAGAPSSN